MAHALKTNILEFSAFKEASFRNSLVELITDTGKLPTWSEFRKQALATSQLYNVNWLQTEFNQTVATANMTGKWQEFQETKDLYPNLKYVTVGDKRVRDKHKKWDGFIAPIDHPIWKKLLPPNDWGCRCDVIPTDETPTKGYETFKAPIKAEFANNGAISGKIFKESAYEIVLSKQDRIKATQNAFVFGLQKVDKSLKRHLERAIYELPRDWQFQEIYTNGKGKVLKHLLASEKAEDFKEVLESAKLFADDNKIVEMMPVISDKNLFEFRKKVFPNYNLLKNPDLRIDKVYMDVKRPERIGNIQGNANKAFKQLSIAIIHTGKIKITKKQIENRVKDIYRAGNINKDGNHNYNLPYIYFLVEGKLYKYKKP